MAIKYIARTILFLLGLALGWMMVTTMGVKGTLGILALTGVTGWAIANVE